jgi:hypothetical protein
MNTGSVIVPPLRAHIDKYATGAHIEVTTMPLTIVVEQTEEFGRDIAHYHVPADSVERISQHLRADPSRGDEDATKPEVRRWEVGGFCVSYSFHVISAETALLILLRIRPAEAKRSGMGRKALELVDILNRIKSLATGWDIGR